jgi:hypothetical protein
MAARQGPLAQLELGDLEEAYAAVRRAEATTTWLRKKLESRDRQLPGAVAGLLRELAEIRTRLERSTVGVPA